MGEIRPELHKPRLTNHLPLADTNGKALLEP